MKKLLTVLLTLVMAVCLINLNSNKTKAADDNSNLATGVDINNAIKGISLESGELKQIVFCENKPNGAVDTGDSIALDEAGNGKAELATKDNTIYIYGSKKYTFNADSTYMFKDLSALEDISFDSDIDTSNVKLTSDMFSGCSSLTTLDLSKFSPIPQNFQDCNNMFYNCSNLVRIYVKKDGFDLSNGPHDICFDGCSKLIGSKGTSSQNHLDAQYARIDGGLTSEGLFSDIDGTLLCKGLKFDDSGEWSEKYTTITDTNVLKNKYGIIYDSETNTITLTRGLDCKEQLLSTLTIENPDITINIEKDIKITHSDFAYGASANALQLYTNATFNGNGHTLTIEKDYNSALYIDYECEFNNINIKVNSNNDGSSITSLSSAAHFTDLIKLKGECVVEIKNTNESVDAFALFCPEIRLSNGYYKGSTDSAGTNLKKIIIDGGKWTVEADAPSANELVNAKYVIIVNHAGSKPSPDPGKKDESCEKVIGPTWHWNNDKGICEDYGVVGTSTR